jgi:hypothetical protein
MLGEADRDLALRTIELGLRLKSSSTATGKPGRFGTLRAAFSAAGLGASQVRS